jgi:glucokinase
MSSVIGVDIGGTKVAVAPLRGRRLHDSLIKPTDLSSGPALLEQLVEMVDEVRDDGLEGVGIGVPSVVEFETGRVVSSVNVPLADVPLRQVLGERLGVPVFVDNDATVAALAEAHDHELRQVARNLVMLTIGTGVGGGLVLGGRIYRGSTGGAAEVGHTLIGLDLSRRVPPPNQFPQPGSLESLASGHALDALSRQEAHEHPQSALGRIRAGGVAVDGTHTVDLGLGGDPSALHLIEIWAEKVGIGVANAINIFDPEEVVIGGGAARAGEALIEAASRVAKGYVHPGLLGHATVRLARHGVRAGVLGAALLAAHEVEDAAVASAREARSS